MVIVHNNNMYDRTQYYCCDIIQYCLATAKRTRNRLLLFRVIL